MTDPGDLVRRYAQAALDLGSDPLPTYTERDTWANRAHLPLHIEVLDVGELGERKPDGLLACAMGRCLAPTSGAGHRGLCPKCGVRTRPFFKMTEREQSGHM